MDRSGRNLLATILDSVAEDHKDLVLIKNGGNEAASGLAGDEEVRLEAASLPPFLIKTRSL
jgi:hypothetical protein